MQPSPFVLSTLPTCTCLPPCHPSLHNGLVDAASQQAPTTLPSTRPALLEALTESSSLMMSEMHNEGLTLLFQNLSKNISALAVNKIGQIAFLFPVLACCWAGGKTELASLYSLGFLISLPWCLLTAFQTRARPQGSTTSQHTSRSRQHAAAQSWEEAFLVLSLGKLQSCCSATPSLNTVGEE